MAIHLEQKEQKVYRVTGPDGEKYKVTGPNNATDDEIFAAVEDQLKSQRVDRQGSNTEGEHFDNFESDETDILTDTKDLAVGFVGGVPKAAGALVSLGSYVPGIHYIADPLAEWLQSSGEWIDQVALSDRALELKQELSDRLTSAAHELGEDATYEEIYESLKSQGGEAGSFIADHPGQTLQMITDSLPYLFGGGWAGGLAKKGAEKLAGKVPGASKVANMGRIATAATGEGLITSGEVLKQTIAQTDSSGDYDLGTRIPSIGAGIGTGIISMLGGRYMAKKGLSDIDVAITDKITGQPTNLLENAAGGGIKNYAKKVGLGGLSEGVEEFAQGAQEKMFENLGTGEHLASGVAGEAVLGAAAGAGQGAGINIVTGFNSGSDLDSDAAADAAVNVVKQEKVQAQEDELFMLEAVAATTDNDIQAFGEKWANQLGISVEEVFQDKRYQGAIESVAADEDVADQNEKRRLEGNREDSTFPDPKTWHKENIASKRERQKIELGDESTEIGQAFATWQRENVAERYGKGNKVVNDFLNFHSSSEETTSDSEAEYLAALDGHIAYEEGKAGRTEEQQLEADGVIGSVLDIYNKALADNDLGMINVVEAEVAKLIEASEGNFSVAEWNAAKRASSIGKKPVVPTIETPPIGEPVIAGEAPKLTPKKVEKPKYTANSERAKKHQKAVDALGDGYDSTEYGKAVTKAILKGVGNEKFDAVVATAVETRELHNLDDPKVRVLGQVKLDGRWQKRVIPFLLDAAKRGVLDDYGNYKTVNGKETFLWHNEAIAAELGVTDPEQLRNAGKRINEAISTYESKHESIGDADNPRETVAAFNKRVEAKRKAGDASFDPDADAVSDEIKGGTPTVPLIDSDEAIDPISDETGQEGNRASAFSLGDMAGDGKKVGIISSAAGSLGGAQMAEKGSAEKVALDAFADKRADKADPVHLRKVQELLMDRLKFVAKVLKDKGLKADLILHWDAMIDGSLLSFMEQPVEVQQSWIRSFKAYQRSREISSLTKDFSEIIEAHSESVAISKNNQQETIQTDETKQTEKTDDGAKSKSEKVVKGRRSTTTKDSGPRANTNAKGKKATKRVQPKQVKPKPKLSIAETVKAFFTSVPKDRQEVFQEILSKMFGGNIPSTVNERVHVLNNLEELNEQFPNLNFNYGESGTAGVYIHSGETEQVIFVLDAIEPGAEMSVFIHEVGSHLGLDNMLSAKQTNMMVSKIKSWANTRLKSGIEDAQDAAVIARKALDRVGSARVALGRSGGLMSPRDVKSETIAYFLEEAVLAGISPTHDSPAGRLVDSIITAFKKALSKFEAFTQEGIDALTPQDFVDMAMGSAKIALSELGSTARNEAMLNLAKVKDGEQTSLSVNWKSKIDKFVLDRFPKNDEGKYVPDGRLTKKKYAEFQKEQWRLEQKLRSDLEAEVAMRIRHAEEHEQSMDNPDGTVKFSLNDKEKKNSNKEKAEISAWLEKVWNKDVKFHWADLSYVLKQAADGTKFLNQFIEQVKVKMPGAVRWHRAMQMLESTRTEIKQRVEGIANRARDMSVAKLNEANSFLAMSTLDQKWGYDPKVKGKTVKVDPKMKELFDKLTENQQQLIKDIFGHGELMMARKRKIAEAMGVGNFFGTSSLDGPYAPLKRFGNFIVELKSAELLEAEKNYQFRDSAENRQKLEKIKGKEAHYVVSFFDTIGQAERFKDTWKGDYAHSVATERTLKIEEARSADYKVLQKVLGAVHALNLGGNADRAMKQMLNEMYMQTLDDTNARQSQAKREGYAGYDENMVGSFLSHASAEANLIANMEHGAEVNIALAQARDESSADQEELVPVYNMLVAHYSLLLGNPELYVADRIAAVNTFYMLTSSIGYHLTNATQVEMVTVPLLAGVFGYKKSQKAIGRGYKLAHEIVSFAKERPTSNTLLRQTEVHIERAPQKYWGLLKELNLMQLLDVGLEQDLSEWKVFNTGVKALDATSKSMAKIAYRAYQAARLVEAYNRVSSAIAAYDLAMENPAKMKKMGMSPRQYAVHVVRRTQGDFSNLDAPLAVKHLNRSSIGKLAVQYRKFQVLMGWVYANAIKKTWEGDIKAVRADDTLSAEEKETQVQDIKEQRWVGARTTAYLLGHAALFGGIRGLPGIGASTGLYLMLFGAGDEPDDIERIIRRNVDDERLATVLSRGVLALVGLDMSSKLSQDNIFDPFPFIDYGEMFSSGDSVVEGVGTMLLGPTGTQAGNIGRAISYANEGNAWRALEYMMPKLIRAPMESIRLQGGGYTLKNGRVSVLPENMSGLGLILNSFGLPGTQLQKIKWTRGQQFELEQHFNKEQSSIRKAYVNAVKANNKDKQVQLIKDWVRLQDGKARVRYFFHHEPSALRRTPVSSLTNAYLRHIKEEQKDQRKAGF